MDMAQEIYNNRAKPQQDAAGSPVTQSMLDFECCSEVLTFAMQDKYHSFSLGLGTVLECLKVAEQEGHVPPLPDGWWIKIRCMYI